MIISSSLKAALAAGLAALCAFSALPASAIGELDLSEEDRARLSAFVTRFTAAGFREIREPAFMPYEDMIRFGLADTGALESGWASAEDLAESVRGGLGVELTELRSATVFGWRALFDGRGWSVAPIGRAGAMYAEADTAYKDRRTLVTEGWYIDPATGGELGRFRAAIHARKPRAPESWTLLWMIELRE